MLKHDLLKLMNVEQWAKFRRFIADRPQKYVTTHEGVVHPDFLETDIHEFLTTEAKYATTKDQPKAGCSDKGNQCVPTGPDAGSNDAPATA